MEQHSKLSRIGLVKSDVGLAKNYVKASKNDAGIV